MHSSIPTVSHLEEGLWCPLCDRTRLVKGGKAYRTAASTVPDKTALVLIQESGTRVTVYEAADASGVTVDAIRKRIQRGTIPHERHEDSRVYVLLDQATKLQDQNSNETSTVQDNGPVRYETHEFVESLQDQIGFLRRELERKDAILLRMAERIPEIEVGKATSEPQDAPERASEGSDKGNTTPEPPELAERRSWLYRFFFGP